VNTDHNDVDLLQKFYWLYENKGPRCCGSEQKTHDGPTGCTKCFYFAESSKTSCLLAYTLLIIIC
jgi:hypothetical protein